jgi:hypothetical protein
MFAAMPSAVKPSVERQLAHGGLSVGGHNVGVSEERCVMMQAAMSRWKADGRGLRSGLAILFETGEAVSGGQIWNLHVGTWLHRNAMLKFHYGMGNCSRTLQLLPSTAIVTEHGRVWPEGVSPSHAPCGKGQATVWCLF